MSKNIEINIQTASNTYETLYPKTLGSNIDGAVSLATKAISADSLTNSRTIQTNLASTSSASFNGTSNITPGVSGVLPVGNGGTGTTSYSNLANLLSDYISAGATIKFHYYYGTGAFSEYNYLTLNLDYGTQFVLFVVNNGTIGTTASGTKGIGEIGIAPFVIYTGDSTTNRASIYLPVVCGLWDGGSLNNAYGVGMYEVQYTCVKNSYIKIYNDLITAFIPSSPNSTVNSFNRYTDRRVLNHDSYYLYSYYCFIF